MGEHGASGSPGKDLIDMTFNVLWSFLGSHWQKCIKSVYYVPAGVPGPQGFQGEAGAPGTKGTR